MNRHYEQEQRSQHQYTGYSGNTSYTTAAQETPHFYEQPENLGNYSGYARQEQQAYQPYQQQQPVQVFVQFSQGQPYTQPAPFDGSNIAAALSYVCGWFTGILFLIFGFGNRFVRFHALQAILFFGAINIFDIVFLAFFAFFAHYHEFAVFHYVQGFAILFFLFINFLAFVGWLIALFQAGRGISFKLPIVGEIAERMVGNALHVHVK